MRAKPSTVFLSTFVFSTTLCTTKLAVQQLDLFYSFIFIGFSWMATVFAPPDAGRSERAMIAVTPVADKLTSNGAAFASVFGGLLETSVVSRTLLAAGFTFHVLIGPFHTVGTVFDFDVVPRTRRTRHCRRTRTSMLPSFTVTYRPAVAAKLTGPRNKNVRAMMYEYRTGPNVYNQLQYSLCISLILVSTEQKLLEQRQK